MAKVTDEELQQLQELKETIISIVSTMGELSLTKLLLEKEQKQTEKNIQLELVKFEEFQEKERVIYDELQKKYGAGNIDLVTGEVTE